MAKVRTPAVAYLRTSSAANVGVDRDSERRQRAAIQAFAKRAGFEIADGDWYYDAAVSGADPIEGREGFARLATVSPQFSSRTLAVSRVTWSCRNWASRC
jgi:DNA invertase Pin-like site-specific DNA recombinase